jgi:hypothetical protein
MELRLEFRQRLSHEILKRSDLIRTTPQSTHILQ